MSEPDRGRRQRAADRLTSSAAISIYTGAGVAVAVLGLGFGLVTWLGIVDAIVYSFLFVAAIVFFPSLITLFGGGTPLGTYVGRLHLILQAFAFNHQYLVQLDDQWELCPGDADRYWLDGEWHRIEGGFENRSILGWRPFGIVRHKDDSTWADKRVDTKAERERDVSFDQDADESVERGGFEEVEPPIESGVDDRWVLDLKRVYSKGLLEIGDTDLIETVEEVTERGEVATGRTERPALETFGFLMLGVITGFAYVLL